MNINPESDECLARRELASAIDFDHNVWTTTNDAGEHITVIGEDFRNLRPMIDEYVMDISSSEAPAWEISKDAKGKTKLKGLYLSKYSRFLNALRNQTDPYLRSKTRLYSNRFELFCEACDELDLKFESFKIPGAPSGCPGKLNADLENELIALIRSKAKEKVFTRNLYDRENTAKRRYQRGVDLVDGIFNIYAKVMVVRLDLYFDKESASELPIDRVQNDLARLWRNSKKNKLFEHLVGYIRRIEYSEFKRYHIHLILFFNGHEVKKDYHYANEIGKYWVERIRNGKGSFNNCNKNKYEQHGIGMIHHLDMQKRKWLKERCVRYLAKDDQCVEVQLKKIRSFVTSEIPKKKSAAGRPRIDRNVCKSEIFNPDQ